MEEHVTYTSHKCTFFIKVYTTQKNLRITYISSFTSAPISNMMETVWNFHNIVSGHGVAHLKQFQDDLTVVL